MVMEQWKKRSNIKTELNRSYIALPLELRQYKNDSIWSKDKLALNLPHFFTRLYGQWKRAAISKLIW